jgi:uncharacterized protein HemX
MAFWRRTKGAPEEAPTEPVKPPAEGSQPEKAAEAASPPAEEVAAEPVAPADPNQRIDGLRAWLAQVDRKVGIRTYALGAAAVLGLAAGIVGIVLALGVEEDSAKQEDVKDLREQISAVDARAEAQAEQGVESVTQRLNDLEADLSRLSDDQTTIEDELSVVQDDIRDLRDEVSQLDSGGSGNP